MAGTSRHIDAVFDCGSGSECLCLILGGTLHLASQTEFGNGLKNGLEGWIIVGIFVSRVSPTPRHDVSKAVQRFRLNNVYYFSHVF